MFFRIKDCVLLWICALAVIAETHTRIIFFLWICIHVSLKLKNRVVLRHYAFKQELSRCFERELETNPFHNLFFVITLSLFNIDYLSLFYVLFNYNTKLNTSWATDILRFTTMLFLLCVKLRECVV